MKHTLQINVSPQNADSGIVGCRKVTVREKFLRFLLGDKTRLTVIVPGDSVEEVAITEVADGGEAL
ncbi:MAG: hypothetical protein LUF68_08850 [Clostridiales bacterium]|nr:hypothetical protein [Clostridiales bacterium]